MNEKIYSFMGLAKKAGKLLSGEFACEGAVKGKKVFLVIVAENASDNTKKKFTDLCSYRGIEIRFFGEKENIGKFIGKELRAVVAISEKGFADRLKQLIDGTDLQNGGGQFGKA